MLSVLDYRDGYYKLSNNATVTYAELSKLGKEVQGLHFENDTLVFVDIPTKIRPRNTYKHASFVGINGNATVYFPLSASKSHNATTKRRASHHVVNSQYFDGSKYKTDTKNVFKSATQYDLYGNIYPLLYKGIAFTHYDVVSAFPFAINYITSRKKGIWGTANIFNFNEAKYTKEYKLVSTPYTDMSIGTLLQNYENYIHYNFDTVVNNALVILTQEYGLNVVKAQEVLLQINFAPIWELGKQEDVIIYGLYTLDNGIEVINITNNANVIDTYDCKDIRTKMLNTSALPYNYIVDKEHVLSNAKIKVDAQSTVPKEYELPATVHNIAKNGLTISISVNYSDHYPKTTIKFPSTLQDIDINAINISANPDKIKYIIFDLSDIKNVVLKQKICKAIYIGIERSIRKNALTMTDIDTELEPSYGSYKGIITLEMEYTTYHSIRSQQQRIELKNKIDKAKKENSVSDLFFTNLYMTKYNIRPLIKTKAGITSMPTPKKEK